MFSSVGFIGTGTMGSALARAAVKGAQGAPIFLANRSPKKARNLAKELNEQSIGGSVATATTNEVIARHCSIIFLAVKPQIIPGMLATIAPILAARTDHFVLASLAAGVDAKRIRELVGGDYPVICLMPNTPVEIGAGMVQYCGEGTTPEELSDFEALLSSAGLVDQVNANRMIAATAVSGCGPAFCAIFVEAIADAGVACGLPRDKAQLYAAQMVYGTARLMLENKLHPGQLKDGVCSPAGSTIQGVRTLEARGFRSAAFEAVLAAYEKTVEMGDV